jgi:uncharacterized protein (TIRG00374 family)
MALGLVAFILYLWVFVGFDGLFTLLSKLNVYQYSLFLALAVGAFVVSVVFDSLIWHSLLDSLSVKVKLRKLVLYNWIGNFVELIIPGATVGGEVVRIALAQKETNHDTGIAAATVIGSRIISTFVYSGGLLVAFALLLCTHQLPAFLITPVILVVLGTAITLSGIFVIAYKEGAVDTITRLISKVIKRVMRNPEKQVIYTQKIHDGIFSFSEVFKTFKKQPRKLIKPAFFAVAAWMFSLIVYLLIFYALNFTSISLIDLATVYCIVTTVETVTAGVPVGAVEVTMVNMFAIYGVPLAVAGAATTIVRLLTFWCQILVGYPIVEWMGIKSLLKGNIKPPVIVKPPVPTLTTELKN